MAAAVAANTCVKQGCPLKVLQINPVLFRCAGPGADQIADVAEERIDRNL